jgi:hypothetical protein
VNKIPVGKTIAYAYGFTFGNLGAIIGLSWVSLVVVAVLQFLPYAGGHSPMIQPDNAAQAGQQALESLGSFFLILLLYSVVYVAVTRQALGLRQGSAMVHFALGAPEFRVFGAMLLFVLVLFGTAMVFGLAMALLTVLFGGASMPVAAAAAVGVAMLCGVAAFLYVAIRLGFLIAPVTVAEAQISLTRGWILTAGNFWRLFAVVLAIGTPIVLLYAIGLWAIMGPGLFAPLPDNPDQMKQAMDLRFAALGQNMPMYIGLTLLIAPFNFGLNLGAAAFVYRALVPPRGGMPANSP